MPCCTVCVCVCLCVCEREMTCVFGPRECDCTVSAPGRGPGSEGSCPSKGSPLWASGQLTCPRGSRGLSGLIRRLIRQTILSTVTDCLRHRRDVRPHTHNQTHTHTHTHNQTHTQMLWRVTVAGLIGGCESSYWRPLDSCHGDLVYHPLFMNTQRERK